MQPHKHTHTNTNKHTHTNTWSPINTHTLFFSLFFHAPCDLAKLKSLIKNIIRAHECFNYTSHLCRTETHTDTTSRDSPGDSVCKHTFTHTPTLTLTHSHTPTHSLTHTHTHPLSHTPSHALTCICKPYEKKRERETHSYVQSLPGWSGRGHIGSPTEEAPAAVTLVIAHQSIEEHKRQKGKKEKKKKENAI